MTKMVYQFRAGAHLKGDAQAVGEMLDEIRAKNDGLEAKTVVDAARPAKSVLHPYFEWDDSTAAELYREDQARHLIRSVEVVFTEPDVEQQKEIRAFVTVRRDSGERVYESTAKALSNADLRKQVLRQAHSELGAVARKYRELQELADVLTAIDKVGDLLTTANAS